MADGESLHLTQVGKVRPKDVASGVENTMVLMNVYLAPRLTKNIVSYGKRKRKGFALVYDGEKHAFARASRDGAIAFDVKMDSNMLCVNVTAINSRQGTGNVHMVVLEGCATTDVANDVQEDTLLHFHQRIPHL